MPTSWASSRRRSAAPKKASHLRSSAVSSPLSRMLSVLALPGVRSWWANVAAMSAATVSRDRRSLGEATPSFSMRALT